MNRRGFLQALLAIPAIAALPVPFGVASAPALLEAEPSPPLGPFSRGVTVTINGEPLAVRSMTWMQEESSYIDITQLNGNYGYAALDEGRLKLETYLDWDASEVVRAAYLTQEKVTVRAQFQAVEFVAEAYVCGATLHLEPGMPVQQDIDLRFVTAKWVR